MNTETGNGRAIHTDAAGIARRFVARAASIGEARCGVAPVLCVDGRSGSGKTTLVASLTRELHRLTGTAPQTLAMDELYPGWGGLAAGSASLARVLDTGRYRRYDWAASAFGDELALDGGRTLIVEGCGSITPQTFAAASRSGAWGGAYGVWVVCPDEQRRARALARDGDMFAPHWDAWAAQERAHFAQAQPIALAHEIVHVN